MPQFNPTVGCSACLCTIICDRIGFTVTFHKYVRSGCTVSNEIVGYGLCTLLGQTHVVIVITHAVSMPGNLDFQIRMTLQNLNSFIQTGS